MPLAVRFAEILADTGVSHGLIGPREVPRLWERHVLNCAVVEDAFPLGARLIDVGSGAGLPGVALALARPDLEVHLVEPMLRRTEWLADIVAELGLTASPCTGAAPRSWRARSAAPLVTARAVARLDKLARWCVPLLEPGGGTVVAMKGRSAAEELERTGGPCERLGLVDAAVTEHGAGVLDEPVLTVDLRFGPRSAGRPTAPPRAVEGEHSDRLTGPGAATPAQSLRRSAGRRQCRPGRLAAPGHVAGSGPRHRSSEAA